METSSETMDPDVEEVHEVHPPTNVETSMFISSSLRVIQSAGQQVLAALAPNTEGGTSLAPNTERGTPRRMPGSWGSPEYDL